MSRAPRDFLTGLFQAALDAVDPAVRLRDCLPPPPIDGRLVIVGAGKAAASMALAAARHYGDRAVGVVVTPGGYGLRPGENPRGIEVIEASHPVPGVLSLRSADRMLAAVEGLGRSDLVVCLLSGGGSALMERPVDGLTLEALQAITRALLKSGAAIGEINTVRKHLSRIKGGRLALAAWPARVEAFAISDVPGDDPSLIASGPTAPDPSTCGDALAILRRHAVDLPLDVERGLSDGTFESPKPGDPRLERSRIRIVGSPADALAAAARLARETGLEVVDLGDRVEGEAAAVAASHARSALQIGRTARPTVILSGGELTVTHAGGGSGGPNREYALALAVALGGANGISALAADTDGVDGTPDAAGAIVAPDTLSRAAALGLAPVDFLGRHDSGGFFKALGDDLVTGPTRNNIADFRAILVDP